MDSRQSALAAWVAQQLETDIQPLEVVSGDASFRRYFRARHLEQTWIAMDAPPEKEDSESFVAIAKAWQQEGISVPKIQAYDLALGFLLLEDQGDTLLLSQLHPEQPNIECGDQYYTQAMKVLIAIQASSAIVDYPLPPYDQALLDREMALFRDWLVTQKLGLNLSRDEENMLASTFSVLAQSALSQPQVPVHRDYHARNLMVLEDDSLGVLDFQDAVQGPITYDLVSLLRDCYIVWPDEQVDRWCQQFYRLLDEAQRSATDYTTFKRWFDWMGLQRHLKASGIFARLSLRDGKHGYLNDIPRTVNYLVTVSAHYDELAAFNAWLTERVVPALQQLDSQA